MMEDWETLEREFEHYGRHFFSCFLLPGYSESSYDGYQPPMGLYFVSCFEFLPYVPPVFLPSS
jgi:hypothetical protein